MASTITSWLGTQAREAATATRPAKTARKSDHIRAQEAYYADAADDEKIEVDEASHIVRNVWIIGNHTKTAFDRTYPQRVLESQKAQYEGKPVNIDHPTQEHLPFDSRFGWLENVRPAKNGKGLRGDLHYNPEHPKAARFVWFAKNNPSMIGMSPNQIIQEIDERGQPIFYGSKYAGPRTVKNIVRVDSVDLVADPNTTHGLESATMDEELGAAAPASEEEGMDSVDHIREHCCKMVEEALAGITDVETLRKASAKIEKMVAKLGTEGDEEAEDEDDKEKGDEDPGEKEDKETMEAARRSNDPIVAKLLKKLGATVATEGRKVAKTTDQAILDRLDKAELELASRRQADEFAKKRGAAVTRARESFKAYKGEQLEKLLSPVFIDKLAVADEATQKQLIDDRLALVGSAKGAQPYSVARESVENGARERINGKPKAALPTEEKERSKVVDDLYRDVMSGR